MRMRRRARIFADTRCTSGRAMCGCWTRSSPGSPRDPTPRNLSESPRDSLHRMEPYARHVLVCVGGFCSPDHRGRELYRLLPSLLQREGLLFGPTRVKRGETPCLGVCTGGPVVVVYPEGIWYGN